ncbi:MAG TPA: glycosyltransferase family 2 protein, partial [Thermomicrobiales bacterium]|nr:glycosyltransferase family 2 protein [Thermomicrobiales bacterium]
MRPLGDHAANSTTDEPIFDAIEDDEGCNCGSPPARKPLLTADLVIAARERAREPELPQATVDVALAASLPATAATYDLVMFAPPDVETARRAWMVAVEFARREHRVFWIKPATAPERTPKPPKLETIGLPVKFWAGEGDRTAMRAAIAELRTERDIATALLYLPTPKWGALADELRREWGWSSMAEAQPIEPGMPPIPRDGPLPGDLLLDWAAREGDASGRRLALRAERTWPERWRAIDRAARSLWPRASVIVITYDNLAFSKMCLASVIENTAYPNYELIVVDNGSTDGTPAYLTELAGRFPNVRAIFNDGNRGFGPANNQGLAAATGDRFVLLNNDTLVPPGWLARLLLPLDDPRVGLIGAATNRTCNEAQVDRDYATY